MRHPTSIIRQLLAASGPSDNYTSRELAQRVYETDQPTSPQLAAVRRSVTRLVAEGVAERRGHGTFAHWRGPHHARRVRRVAGDSVERDPVSGARVAIRTYEERTIQALNPTGVLIGRPLTAAEREDEERRHAEAVARAVQLAGGSR